ncbi:putative pre-mRNA-splicing factor ATP-dependent RNA helicase DEAH5 [Artemisia annua]|uniref:RNA helicase n=1 Tax=Artemisia annua TaxID=35608 RepID=A0A2U1M411_ARTAN|nr:putative pre-mRNA-splicing factor ATP-dependent RNA helicase DEAH5 [Artemisia annua]
MATRINEDEDMMSHPPNKERVGLDGLDQGNATDFTQSSHIITTYEISPTSTPEIHRINLGVTTLTLKTMGITDIFAFDFMNPPSPQALLSAMQQLYSLGPLDEEGDLLTKLGRIMAEFPLEPSLLKMLLASVDLGCSDEILTIIAMLQTGNIFYRPSERQSKANEKKAKFIDPEGDQLTLLAVYKAWKANNFSLQWCYENFVQVRSLRSFAQVLVLIPEMTFVGVIPETTVWDTLVYPSIRILFLSVNKN